MWCEAGYPSLWVSAVLFWEYFSFSFEKELCQDITHFRHPSRSIWLEPSLAELEDTAVIVCEKNDGHLPCKRWGSLYPTDTTHSYRTPKTPSDHRPWPSCDTNSCWLPHPPTLPNSLVSPALAQNQIKPGNDIHYLYLYGRNQNKTWFSEEQNMICNNPNTDKDGKIISHRTTEY